MLLKASKVTIIKAARKASKAKQFLVENNSKISPRTLPIGTFSSTDIWDREIVPKKCHADSFEGERTGLPQEGLVDKLREIEAKFQKKKYMDQEFHLLSMEFIGIDKKLISHVGWKSSDEIKYVAITSKPTNFLGIACLKKDPN